MPPRRTATSTCRSFRSAGRERQRDRTTFVRLDRFRRLERTDSWNDNNGTCTTIGRQRRQVDCKDAGGKWKAANHNTWNGCVMDRDQDYDVTNTKPNGQPKLFPAEQYSSCPVPLMGLTYDWTALNYQSRLDDRQTATPIRRSALPGRGSRSPRSRSRSRRRMPTTSIQKSSF